MLLKKTCLVILALSLGGCAAKRLPISEVRDVKPTFSGASGVDVYAGKRRAGEAVPDFRGDQLVEVRSFSKQKSKKSGRLKDVEFEGARCALSGTGFKSSVTTPAKVRVPIYGYASSELAIRCVADGYAPKVTTARAFNKTKTDRLASAGSAGLLGIVFVAAVNAASDEKKHVFLYRPISVHFKK